MMLLELPISCPKCGKRPNLRVTSILQRMVEHADPEHVVGTWGCQGKGCALKLLITAGDVQHARQP